MLNIPEHTMSCHSSFQDSLMSLISDWWVVLTVFVMCVILFVLIRKDPRVANYIDKFDGPLSLPLLGCSLWFLRPNYKLVPLALKWVKKYKGCYRVWVGSRAYLVLFKAPFVEKILSSSIHIDKSSDYKWFHKWLGLGLLTSKSNKWHGRRKLLTPTFHFKILEEFLAVFNEQGNIFVDILKKGRSDGKPFDIFPYVTKCALDIICETAMGKKVNAQRGSGADYVEAVYGYGHIITRKLITPWLQVDWIWKLLGYAKLEEKYLKILHNFTEKVIIDKQRERKLRDVLQPQSLSEEDEKFGTKKRKAFLDLLLDVAETENSLTFLDIREETDTFMFEGHDTTAANMSWTILTLSAHQEHQKRVQEELDEIFGEERDREITSADICRMNYLECCIKETLRLYPSVPVFLRNLTQDVDIGDGRIIPENSTAIIFAMGLHRDPEVFPDPETFRPERFFPENCTDRNPFAYVPFSAGPRNCIGQKFALLEEKTVLAKLLLNFNLEAVYKREDVRNVPDIVLRPMDGIHVRLTERKLQI